MKYTMIIPAGVMSMVSGERLRKPFTKVLIIDLFYAHFDDSKDIRTTVDHISLDFSLAVDPDTLRKHLSGIPGPFEITTSDNRNYRLRPKAGWPSGKKIHLTISEHLKPLGGNIPLGTSISTSFLASDTLSCLGLFSDGKEVSSSDTLFLENNYTLRFNRPLLRKALSDYFLVNGREPDNVPSSEVEIKLNRFLAPLRPCTITLKAGMPSVDSAFLFSDIHFVLMGDSNRIDPLLPTFNIKGIIDVFIPTVTVTASFLSPLRRNAQGFTFNQPQMVTTDKVVVNISTESRRIPVQVTTDHSFYAPGDSVTVILSVPPEFSSATALVMAVDEGILLLSGETQTDIFQAFEQHPLGARQFTISHFFRCLHGPFDYDSSTQLGLRPRRLGVSGISYGASYGSGFGRSSLGGINDLIGGLMGGDGGCGLELRKRGMVRNSPLPCACFFPNVTFDVDGKAACSFLLPGNLTRWRITAIVDDTASFGSDTTSFEAKKKLMVRPQLPRFLRVGDSASVVYIVENRSGAQRTILSGVATGGDTTVDTFVLSDNGVRHCNFPLIARAAGTDTLLFMAQCDKISDAIRPALPVIFERPRDVTAIGGSTVVDSISIPVVLPNPDEVDSGKLAMTLSTTRMQNIREGVRYLFNYPYGCLEQQGSKILPLITLGDFADRFRIPMLEKGDEGKVITSFLDRIGDFQNSANGGLGYWPTDSGCSSPWLTAYVLEIMLEARNASYPINDRVYSRALDYLRHELRRRDKNKKKQFLDTYTQLVIAKAGTPDRQALRHFHKMRADLPLCARINLLKAMDAAGRFRRKIKSLQRNLQKNLIEKDRLAYFAPGESQGFEFCHESPVRQTALALEALLETGARTRFDEPMIRWLAEQRRSGRWRNTQENIAVFRAFASYTRIYENDYPKLEAVATLAGSDWFGTALQGREGVSFTAEKSLHSIPTAMETAVDLHRSGAGRLYYDLVMTTIPAGRAPPESNGLSIERRVVPIDALGTPLDSSALRIGQLFKIILTIRCDQNITFTAMKDPVPAGCEVINPGLNSSDRSLAMQITGWDGPARLSYREFRNSCVQLFADDMPVGEYHFSYLMKTTVAGRFLWPAPTVEAMYYPEVYGRGSEEIVKIGDAREE